MSDSGLTPGFCQPVSCFGVVQPHLVVSRTARRRSDPSAASPPKMARQSQVPPQTLSPVNLGAYGTPSPSLPSGSSAGAAAKPPINIADLWAQLAAASPTGGGRDRSSPAGVPKRPLTFKQQLLLGSMGCHDEDVLHATHTNTEFNVLLAEGRKYRDDFQAQHGAKPASTFLYNVTAEIHEGDMPDKATATHATIMQLWIAAAGSLRADTAIALIYDYGMDAGTSSRRTKTSRSRVYVGQSRDPQRRFQAHARNPPSRMKDDARHYQPFRDHFTLTRLMSTANPALAQKMEALYIAQFKARGPGGYNVLRGPPSASPAFYMMSRRRAGSAHMPTAVTVQDDDAPATLA
ncbi:hypothetical protein VOLCADRAFT_86626 [Volvox carteri f. nagariensis]|uniref:GIY-YIG domain-containing protein n=1 Tax=Volvox carteri f. nagariensis TaxID=3068 RepID=D8TJ62_VOLCA|nr:uncharacterized protein VOLCADRAFT_86626 [Volvox carteri f. nagariensis]EFJ52483.1 hypothetical protein VOLCADRAFT_86626 [Volvox carteri f. nagariensis]|eukprot:XP_002946556.1 hypothetical protein VOLCADRAFT_86626 [Volvox carteri f. nagariensis]